MLEVIALYLAGLSFFFTGMSGLSDNLRQMAGHRFRVLLSHSTNHPVRAGLVGVIAGAMTQSASVVAFILSGMIATGLLPLGRALIVLGCANIGTAALVFIAAIDLHLPILFLVGISGLILAFRLLVKWKPGINALLSVGLVFFGLDMMKEAFTPISSSHGMTSVANFFDYWPDMAFFLGIGMRMLVHSSSATAAIAMTINKGGMLSEFPSMISMAGLGLGTALATYFLSSNQRGVPKQIAIYQMWTNVAATVVLAALLLVEHETGIPLLMSLMERISSSTSGRMALMYLFLNILIAALSIAGERWAPKWLARMSPPTPEEHLSRPMYLQTEALFSPETAPDLVALEQMRLLRVLETYLEGARSGNLAQTKTLHEAAITLGGEITQFLEALMKQPIATDLAARIISFQRKQETLRTLEENVFLFAQTMGTLGSKDLPGRMIEALDTILLTAADALKSYDPADIELLVGMTDDRGSAMERLRGRYRLESPETAGDVAALHYATTLFERNVWLLRQLALWIREDARTNPRVAPTG
jgi:phosphate:Na+ symporter